MRRYSIEGAVVGMMKSVSNGIKSDSLCSLVCSNIYIQYGNKSQGWMEYDISLEWESGSRMRK